MSRSGIQFAFGYGSLLSPATWEDRRPHRSLVGLLDPVGPAWLPDHAPAFHYHSSAWGGHGALDAEPRRGAITPGQLFRIDERGRRALDRREGHPDFYERAALEVLRDDGTAVRAWVWRVTEARREPRHVPPRADYLEHCLDGYRHWSLGEPAGLLAAAEGRPVPPLDLLAVYGSLRRGASAHGRLVRHGAEVLATVRLPGRMVDMGSWPAAWPGPAGPGIVAELVRLRDPARALADLDAYEGAEGRDGSHRLFRRAVVRLPAEAGVLAGRLAWCYVAADPRLDGPVVPSGDWLAR